MVVHAFDPSPLEAGQWLSLTSRPAVLQSKLQGSQSYMMRTCLKRKKEKSVFVFCVLCGTQMPERPPVLSSLLTGTTGDFGLAEVSHFRAGEAEHVAFLHL